VRCFVVGARIARGGTPGNRTPSELPHRPRKAATTARRQTRPREHGRRIAYPEFPQGRRTTTQGARRHVAIEEVGLTYRVIRCWVGEPSVSRDGEREDDLEVARIWRGGRMSCKQMLAVSLDANDM
jgi:hypothetical protein